MQPIALWTLLSDISNQKARFLPNLASLSEGGGVSGGRVQAYRSPLRFIISIISKTLTLPLCSVNISCIAGRIFGK